MEKQEYTKFEKARVIGARALQLAHGAPPLIKVPAGVTEPLDLAELEFEKGIIPITIIKG
ncbi:DNA-directed RNA polymerase subunit K [Candidatus Marsarchaeota archaeon]|nr:DNA-directed RNA polymerase subunit K [Candidatus Marsarchaeota archaeon]MCL5404929.1 DNA-directed RNA polymerase subunit K [Candidatus Marsarchaeota archaeon]